MARAPSWARTSPSSRSRAASDPDPVPLAAAAVPARSPPGSPSACPDSACPTPPAPASSSLLSTGPGQGLLGQSLADPLHHRQGAHESRVVPVPGVGDVGIPPWPSRPQAGRTPGRLDPLLAGTQGTGPGVRRLHLPTRSWPARGRRWARHRSCSAPGGCALSGPRRHRPQARRRSRPHAGSAGHKGSVGLPVLLSPETPALVTSTPGAPTRSRRDGPTPARSEDSIPAAWRWSQDRLGHEDQQILPVQTMTTGRGRQGDELAAGS